MQSKLDELIGVMATLRGPGGCPWDAKQTHQSLVKYLIEESYELVDAIESGSPADLKEELGDVLYQVLFHADIAAHDPDEGFDIQDIAESMTRKMVGRHPHVFANETSPTDDDAAQASWEDIKAREKSHRTSVLDGIPQGMPALALADKVIGRAERIGLIESGDGLAIPVQSEDELGPILLAIVASARARGMDAERALRTAVRTLQDEIRDAEES